MSLHRRAVLVAAAASLARAAPAAPVAPVATPTGAQAGQLTRPIGRTGERIPAVGLGTWLTFDTPITDSDALARHAAVVRRFFAEGGALIDSSPMYGHAEAVLGQVLPQPAPRLFSATKVWTPLAAYGPVQMRRSMALWRLARVDLMQVHNLVNWREHLPTLRRWRDEGLVRHIGVTTSHGYNLDELQRIVRSVALDTLQVTYHPLDRRAEPLMQLAADRGVGVIVNRPFDGGAIPTRLQRTPLPPLAAELACTSWATLVLKWEISHPAVICAIPATTNPAHVAENLAALRPPWPGAAQRGELLRLFEKVLD